MERDKDIKVLGGKDSKEVNKKLKELKKELRAEQGGFRFTLEQIDEVTHKLNIAIATLEILDVASCSSLEIETDSLSPLVSEAKDRLIEAREILNPEMDKGIHSEGRAT
jgi:hypothetical protein